MLKRLRWFLYLLVVVSVGFYSWQFFQYKSAASNDPTLNKFKKDLGIAEVSPIAPPTFTLTDQYGKVVSLSDLKIKNWSSNQSIPSVRMFARLFLKS